jgi:hypothetical protein
MGIGRETEGKSGRKEKNLFPLPKERGQPKKMNRLRLGLESRNRDFIITISGFLPPARDTLIFFLASTPSENSQMKRPATSPVHSSKRAKRTYLACNPREEDNEALRAHVERLEAVIAKQHEIMTSLQGLAVPIGHRGLYVFETVEQLRDGILDAHAENQKRLARTLADGIIKQCQLLEATSPTSPNASRLLELQGTVMQLEFKSQCLVARVEKKTEELMAARQELRKLSAQQAVIKSFAEHDHPHPADSGQLGKDMVRLCNIFAPHKSSLLEAVNQQFIVGRLVSLQSSHDPNMKLTEVVGPKAAKQEMGNLAADARVLFLALRSDERLDIEFYTLLMLDSKSEQQLKSLLRNSLRSMTAFLAHVRVTYGRVNIHEGSSYTALTRGQVLYLSLRYLAACQYMQLAHTGGHNALLAVTSVLGHTAAAEVDIDGLHDEFCRAAHSLSADAGQPVVADVLGGIIKQMWKAGFAHFYGQRRVDLAKAAEQAAVAAAVRQALTEVPVVYEALEG